MRNEDLSLFFKSVSFRQDSDGFFSGIGQNNRNGSLFKIALFEQNIACFKDDEILFQVPFNISLGTFLVIAQEFGIIHERFIYERVAVIEEDFDDDIWDDFEDEEDTKRKNQIAQMKNSKFMQLLTKGKKNIN